MRVALFNFHAFFITGYSFELLVSENLQLPRNLAKEAVFRSKLDLFYLTVNLKKVRLAFFGLKIIKYT